MPCDRWVLLHKVHVSYHIERGILYLEDCIFVAYHHDPPDLNNRVILEFLIIRKLDLYLA